MRSLFTFLFLLIFVSQAGAAPVPLKYNRIDLSDGRVLLNVEVKSYDPATGTLLVAADGKAVQFPIKLLPQPFRDRLKKDAPRAGRSNSVVPGPKEPTIATPPREKAGG